MKVSTREGEGEGEGGRGVGGGEIESLYLIDDVYTILYVLYVVGYRCKGTSDTNAECLSLPLWLNLTILMPSKF